MSWDLTIYGHANWSGERSIIALNDQVVHEPSHHTALESLGFHEIFAHRSKPINFAINQIFHARADAGMFERSISDAWMERPVMLAWLSDLAELAVDRDALTELLPYASEAEEFEFFGEMAETFLWWRQMIERFDGDDFLWINSF